MPFRKIIALGIGSLILLSSGGYVGYQLGLRHATDAAMQVPVSPVPERLVELMFYKGIEVAQRIKQCRDELGTGWAGTSWVPVPTQALWQARDRLVTRPTCDTLASILRQD
jgi:hypothetical protein